MANFWNLHTEAGWQLHGGHGCHFSPGPLYELLILESPLLFTWGGSEGPPQESSIQDTRYQPRTQWSLTVTGTAHAFEHSVSDRPSGGNLLSLGDEESLHFSLRLSHQGPTFIFPGAEHRVFINTVWGYVRGSFLSHTGHCSHSHPTSWQLLLAGRPGFCLQNSATAVWVGHEPALKFGQWH